MEKSCNCPVTATASQSLDELDFERGIWKAALDGDYDAVVKKLKKEDPSSRDSCGFTALHYAARNGHLNVCELLLHEGANPNSQTHGGATALHRAAFLGHCDVVKLLLKHKANPMLCDSDLMTPLHKAAKGGHAEVAQILLADHPELKERMDQKGFFPFQYVDKNNTRLFQLLCLQVRRPPC